MENLLNIILEMTIYSSVLIMAILAIRALWMDKINIKIISVLWIILLARLIVPFSFETNLHFDSLIAKGNAVTEENIASSIENDSTTSASTAIGDWTENSNYHLEYGQSNTAFDEVNATTAVIVEKSIIQKLFEATKSISLQTYVVLIWLIGACVIFGLNAYRLVQFKSKLKGCEQVKTTYINEIISAVERKLGVRNYIKVIRCEHVDMPVTFGLFQPVILLPVGFENKVTSEKLELILIHEACHIKRYDMLKNYLWLAVKVIHWFNPLVWIAYKEYRDDIELAVDYMITKAESKERAMVYSQSILDVLHISKGFCKVPMALTFCNDKNKIKKRIKGIVVKGEKKRSLGALSLLIAAVLIVVCFTTACQPTPENAVVQNKNNNDIMETTGSDSIESEDTNLSLEDNNNVQSENESRIVIGNFAYKQSLVNNISLNANAPISVPDAETLPIVTYRYKEFSQEEIDTIIDYLFKGNPIYDYNSGSICTKEEIENQIVKIKYDYNSLNSPMAIAGNFTDLESLHNIRDALLEGLYSQLETAPAIQSLSEISTKPSNGIIHGIGFANDMKYDFFYTDPSNEIIERNFLELSFSAFDEYGEDIGPKLIAVPDVDWLGCTEYDVDGAFSCSIEYVNSKPQSMDMTPQEAIAIAKDTFDILGAGNDVKPSGIFYVENSWLEKNYYVVQLSRYVSDGLRINYVFSDNIGAERGETSGTDGFSEGVPHEEMKLIISDEGILNITWKMPLERVEAINNNVEIVPIEEILSVFKQEFINTYSMKTNSILDYTIYDVSLNYGMARIPNERDLFMAIPLWDFYAEREMTYVDNSGNKGETFYDKYSMLTINGIDGTRFNKEYGN